MEVYFLNIYFYMYLFMYSQCLHVPKADFYSVLIMNYEGPYNWFQHFASLNQAYLFYSPTSWYISLMAIWKHILSIIWHDITDAHVYIDHAEVSACDCMFNSLFACSPCLCVHLNTPFFP